MRRTAVLLVALAPIAVAGPTPAELEKALGARDASRIERALEELRGSLEPAHVKALLAGAGAVHTAGKMPLLVELLGTAHGPALLELVKGFDKARDPALRFLVLDALHRMQDPVAEETMVRAATKDDDAGVAVHAVRCLGERPRVQAIEALLDVLEATERNRSRALLASEARRALGGLLGQEHGSAKEWRAAWEQVRQGWRPPKDGVAAVESGTRTNVLERMKRRRPEDLRTIERLDKDSIVVVEGDYDQVQDVLAALKIPCEVIADTALDAYALDPVRQVLVLNCDGEPKSAAAVEKVREFVARGGYLFSSDWELTNILIKSFPNLARSGGRRSAEHVVEIQPCGGSAAHPLLRDVLPLSPWERAGKRMTWKVDGASEFTQSHEAILVLVEAPELTPIYGTPAVAITFGLDAAGRPIGGTFVPPPPRPRTGDGGAGGTKARKGGAERAVERLPGRVLHVISHFQHQADASGDGFALQQLLLNFVLEKQAARRAATRGD